MLKIAPRKFPNEKEPVAKTRNRALPEIRSTLEAFAPSVLACAYAKAGARVKSPRSIWGHKLPLFEIKTASSPTERE